MPPRGVKSAKRKRQYEHIKESEEARGSSRAEEIAAHREQAARAGRRDEEVAPRSQEVRRQKVEQLQLAAEPVLVFDGGRKSASKKR